MATNEQRLAALRGAIEDFPRFARLCLKIRTKLGDPAEPLVLNTAQVYIHERLEAQRAKTGRVRAILLKGRQQGASTYTEARFYWLTALRPGTQAVIIAHEQLASDNLFGMAVRYHEHMPEDLRPATSAANARELRFGKLDSGYKVLTAGSRAVGRSSTAQLLHASEFAYWDQAEEHLAGIGQAVPDVAGSEVIIESTANGLGNAFHRLWQEATAGSSDYQAVFVPWFWQEEYRREVPAGWSPTGDEKELQALFRLTDQQLVWRRHKIDSDFLGDLSRFKAEYPCTPDEAFQAESRDVFVQAADVVAARNWVFGEPVSGPLVLGVDPARFGADRTALCWRRGREVVRMLARQGLDTMQVAGLVVHHIRTDRPVRVFIDVIGLGAGVVDRLRELGYGEIVTAVNWAERAEEPERYRNRRAEGWSRMKEWLRDRPVRIPDADALAQDLLQPGYSYDSSGRLLIESKEKIKDRGAPSPDLADALALTFAELVADDSESKREATGTQVPRMADSIGY